MPLVSHKYWLVVLYGEEKYDKKNLEAYRKHYWSIAIFTDVIEGVEDIMGGQKPNDMKCVENLLCAE